MTEIYSHILVSRATRFRMKHDPELCLRYLPFGPLQRVRLTKPLFTGPINVRLIRWIDLNRNPSNATHGCEPQQEDLDCLDTMTVSVSKTRLRFRWLRVNRRATMG